MFLAFLKGFFVDVTQLVLGISKVGSDGDEVWWSQFDMWYSGFYLFEGLWIISPCSFGA